MGFPDDSDTGMSRRGGLSWCFLGKKVAGRVGGWGWAVVYKTTNGSG